MLTPNTERMISRREMLAKTSTGFGALAWAAMKSQASVLRPHRTPTAKHVIFCYMSGGVSHVDSFDPKPRLRQDHGKPMPMPVERTQFNQNGNIFGSPFEFKQYGESGIPVSSLFPHVATCVDDIAVVRSMTSKFSEHGQANYFLHTGFPFLGHPSAGAWAGYGLGSENENLPGFVVLQSGGASTPIGGVGLFSNGFLPAQHQGTMIAADRENAVRNISPFDPIDIQRERLDFVQAQDRNFAESLPGDNEVEAAIENYETAFQMQAAVPELCDIRGETEATRRLYALDHSNKQTAAYGRQCLLARRLVERGVRFVELSCLPQNDNDDQFGNPWDQHGALEEGHTNMARQVDQPIAGLLKDLKARGLLDETLVVWAGEFGRTPFSQNAKDAHGRDHNPYGFSIWLAGGGIKGGTIYGATDEYGYHVEDGKCDIYDLWATVLHLLGMDHKRLTYRHGGRDLRITDVHGHVIPNIV